MNKKLIKMLIITFIINITCVMICNYSMADESIKFQLIPSSDTVKPGDTVQVVFKATNNTKGFTELQGMFEYDETAFEKIDFNNPSETFKSGNNFDEVEFIENQLDVVRTGIPEDIKGDQEIFTLNLKIKSGVKDGKYSVSINQIELAGDAEYSTIEKVSVDIKVKAEENNTVSVDGTEKNTLPSNGTEEKQINSNIKTEGESSETKTVVSNISANNSSKLPYTGLNNVAFIVVILVLLIVGGIALFKYNKYKSI